MTQVVSKRDICYIKAVLLLCEHPHPILWGLKIEQILSPTIQLSIFQGPFSCLPSFSVIQFKISRMQTDPYSLKKSTFPQILLRKYLFSLIYFVHEPVFISRTHRLNHIFKQYSKKRFYENLLKIYIIIVD